MARFRPALARGARGFTLIEVLIVGLLIAILAGIAIPMFLGQTGKAKDVAAKNDVKRLVTMVEECKLGKSSYKECDTDKELDDTPGLTWGNGAGEVRVTKADADGYTASAVSDEKTGNQYHVYSMVKEADGRITRTCDVPGGSAGGCQASTW
jgi:prepilin-type N-terminal cleavage/methylation domain-containing protein